MRNNVRRFWGSFVTMIRKLSFVRLGCVTSHRRRCIQNYTRVTVIFWNSFKKEQLYIYHRSIIHKISLTVVYLFACSYHFNWNSVFIFIFELTWEHCKMAPRATNICKAFSLSIHTHALSLSLVSLPQNPIIELCDAVRLSPSCAIVVFFFLVKWKIWFEWDSSAREFLSFFCSSAG